MELNRRGFLVGAGVTTAVSALALEDKLYDGGYATVSKPGIPTREVPLVPAGAKGLKDFTKRCVGCQLCVAACPNGVLRASQDARRLMQPEMGFENGFCRVNCSKCGEVCPAGAILPLTAEAKKHTHVGFAVWHQDRCVAATEGVDCSACAQHCPMKAIYRVALDAKNPGGVQVPFVNRDACIGCGACENVCPARPMPGITVEGLLEHRSVKPMTQKDALAEAKKLIAGGKASVVVLQGGVITAHANGRGVAPILELYDDNPTIFNGAEVVDKLVGRAAAAIFVCGGAKAVHGITMSEGAAKFLAGKKTLATSDTRIQEVLNRDKTGPCPLEQAVKGKDNPPQMLNAIRRQLEKMRAKAK